MRFWHMLIQSNTYQPIFKPWSPMSVGSWALMIFGIFSLLAFLSARAEDGRLQWPKARDLRLPGMLGSIIAVIGGLFGFYVAGYTGVLLAVTNRPIWSDTPLLGMLFVVSAASISAALMILLAQKSGRTAPGLKALHRLDTWVVALEFVVLIAVMISLGPGISRLAERLGSSALFWRHRSWHAASVGSLLAQTMVRRSQRHRGRRIGFGRRFHSSPGHRLLGSRSMT